MTPRGQEGAEKSPPLVLPAIIWFDGATDADLIRKAARSDLGLHYLFRLVAPSEEQDRGFDEVWLGARFSQYLESVALVDLSTGEVIARGVRLAELAKKMDRWTHGRNGKSLKKHWQI